MPYKYRVTCNTCHATIDVDTTRFTVHPDLLTVSWTHCDREQSQPFDPAHIAVMLRRGANYDPGLTNDDIAAFTAWLDATDPDVVYDAIRHKQEGTDERS